jgi:outer membrane lipoprotein-sorting protein
VTYASAAARRLSIFALSAVLLMLPACATAPPPEAETPAPVGKIDVSSLTNAMAQRDRALESLQTSAVMEYSNGADHVKAREDLIVRRPGSLRVEAMSPFGVALVVAAQDSRLQIFEPSKNTLMRGTADAATLARFARIPMAPRDAVGLLMGIVPEAQMTAPPDSVTTEGDMTILAYDEPDHSRRELGFQDEQLVMVRKRTPAGAVNFEIRYADYHDIGGVMFAYKVDADFPLAETRVSFVYKRPIVNSTIADSVFTLTPGPGAKQIDIGMTHDRRIPRDG